MQPSVLSGIRVLELGQLIAGPFAAKILGEFGAEVIKIEPPGAGDPLRKWRLLKDGTSVWWQVQSRNKQSVALDLRKPEAQAIVRDLAKEADVLIENFRPGTLESWGLGWEELHALNPGLVMLRISGYGQTGPYRDRPGFGVIGEAMGGLRHLTAEPGRTPVRVGVSIGDSLAGLHGALGVLLALYHRQVNGGEGQVIDVALYEAVFHMMESLLPEYSAFGVVREPSGAPCRASRPPTPTAARKVATPSSRATATASSSASWSASAGRTWPRILGWRATTAAPSAPRSWMRPSAPGPPRGPWTRCSRPWTKPGCPRGASTTPGTSPRIRTSGPGT